MKKIIACRAALAAFTLTSAAHAETAVSLAFPADRLCLLTLAKEAGIFKKNGLDVTLTKIPQASRHLALASGDIQCAATTVETWIVWNAAGVKTKQICSRWTKFHGADGIAVRADVNSSPIRKTVAASARVITLFPSRLHARRWKTV